MRALAGGDLELIILATAHVKPCCWDGCYLDAEKLMMSVPAHPRIYHIVHVDRLPSILADGGLWCDAEAVQRSASGTIIGMSKIKQRRLHELKLNSHPDLHVGDCVPFYFCPRSVMLYLIFRANHPELDYRGGQGPIIHLEADLRETVAWAEEHGQRWAFTPSNASAYYVDDFCDLVQLDQIDWNAVRAQRWNQHREKKQAEFLIERWFPWTLISRIGVSAHEVYRQVCMALTGAAHTPPVEIRSEWYY